MYFIKKNKEKLLRYHYFTFVYQKPWWYDVQFLRYECTETGNYGSFFALLPPLKTPKNQNFEKMKKKLLEISPFHTCVPKTTIIWGTVPWIKCETEFSVISGHFCTFAPLTIRKIKILKKYRGICYHFTHMYQKSRSYDAWILR